MGLVRVGISGWRYDGWRGVFYPHDLPQRRELWYASRHVPTIEINGTFYSLQRPEYFEAWRADTPRGFRFAVKGGRFITHMLKLRGVETALANFFASGVLRLGDRLGPFLWQLPEMVRFDPARLAAFFALLPRTTEDAARLARRHDRRLAGRAFTRPGTVRRLRHALEVRSESFRDPEFPRLLRRHRIGLVVADSAGRWPMFTDVTAGFVYVRLHGSTEIYASRYRDDELDAWAARIRSWAARGDVYVYFDNDAKVHAPADAARLMQRLAPPGGVRAAGGAAR